VHDSYAPHPLPRGTLPGGQPPALPELQPPSAPPPEAPRGAPPRKSDEQRSFLRRAGGLIVAAALLLFKFGKTALLFAGKAKFLTAAGSMLVSVAAYALIWGWKFGAIFVALLFIHEIGHVIQLRREGIKASAPMFIPFLGAFVAMKELPKDAGAEARVGLAGPVLGTIGCLVPLGLWLATGNDIWQAATFIGFFLNLFNLLPVLPLDGGRAMAALAPWMWLVGLGAVAVLTFTFPSPVLILILLFSIFETYRRWKTRRAGEEGNSAYYQVASRHRFAVFVVYVGLIVVLALAMDYTFLERDFDDV
jgi:Zn-dependent protease